VFLLSFGLVALACEAGAPREPEPFRPPGVVAPVDRANLGEALYLRDCAWCHGPSGQGTGFGPDLDGELDGGAYTDFMLRTGRMPLASPSERTLGGPSRYTEGEIAAIVEHVIAFGGTGPGIPSPDPDAGVLSLGARLYEQNCAACHSMTGVGGALPSGEVAPSLGDVTPIEVAEAMLVGPGCSSESPTCGIGEGAMPRFDLSAEEVDAITAYVRYLQGAPEEGGASIGRIGPVAEGAVALLLGLGLLLLVGRWIGTRSDEEPS
jgi:ubiquinol-cytochrome c reductase cytochrome c subunit